MKKINMFSRLPQEDQNLVLDLCGKYPYDVVVEKLAEPRDQGGLSLTTSASSLCKFYTRYNQDAFALQAIGQYANAIRVNQQAHGEANFEAILALVQHRILDSLRCGKSVADLEKDFRNLQRVQKCFITDTEFRSKNTASQDAYLQHLKRIANAAPEAEFIRNDLPVDPGAGENLPEDFAEKTQYELDLEYACDLPGRELTRTTTFLRSPARVLATIFAAQREGRYLSGNVNTGMSVSQLNSISEANPSQLLALLQQMHNPPAESAQDPASLPPPSEISDFKDPNTHAISHLSPDFAAPHCGPQENHA